MAGTKDHAEDRMSRLIDKVAGYAGVPGCELRSKSRQRKVAEARQLVMYLAYHGLGWTLEQIGSYFGRHHSTVIYSNALIVTRISNNAGLRAWIVQACDELSVTAPPVRADDDVLPLFARNGNQL